MSQIIFGLILAAFFLLVLMFLGRQRRGRELNKLLESVLPGQVLNGFRPEVIEVSGSLPQPVKTYFKMALMQAEKPIKHVHLCQQGSLKIQPKARQWSNFLAQHFATPHPTAFLWDAKIKIAPGTHIRVRDAYSGGVGSGHVSFCSAFTVAHDSDNPELNAGALFRYLAEAVWYPTALLPQFGVTWQALDEHRAVAHLTESNQKIALEFKFNQKGEITGIYTEDRFCKIGNEFFRYPWEGRFSNYKLIHGFRIPTEAEVGWHLPEGWWLFWKATIVSVEYELFS